MKKARKSGVAMTLEQGFLKQEDVDFCNYVIILEDFSIGKESDLIYGEDNEFITDSYYSTHKTPLKAGGQFPCLKKGRAATSPVGKRMQGKV